MFRQNLLSGRWMEVTSTHRKKTSPLKFCCWILRFSISSLPCLGYFYQGCQKGTSLKRASFVTVMKSARLDYRFLGKNSKYQPDWSQGIIIVVNRAEEGISSFLSPTSMWQHPAIWTGNSNCHSLHPKIKYFGLFWNSIADVCFISPEELLAENSGSYFTRNTLILKMSGFDSPSSAAQAQSRAAHEAPLQSVSGTGTCDTRLVRDLSSQFISADFEQTAQVPEKTLPGHNF